MLRPATLAHGTDAVPAHGSHTSEVKMQRPLRILHILHALHMGGMENGVVNLALSQSSSGITHDVCALTEAGEFAQRLPSTSSVYELHKADSFDFATVKKLRALIRRTRPDVLHAHNYSGLLYGSLGRIGTGVPLLMGDHAQLWGWEKTKSRLLLRRLLYRLCCSRIHTVSEGLRQELLSFRLASPQKIITLPNGVDTSRFQPQDRALARTRLGLPADCLVAGMSARLVLTKRHDLLLSAFENLGTNLPSQHLVLAGDQGNAKESVLRAIENHPFRDRIHWLGIRNDMPDVYAAFDLLVLPSESEGMSNACLEAMACGVPAIVHGSCGATEIIVDGQTGLIRDLTSANTLSSALGECFSDVPRLQSWGHTARQHVVTNFSLQSMMSRYETLYRQLARI